MRTTSRRSFRTSAGAVRAQARPPFIRIDDATFYRRQPSASSSPEDAATNQPLFPNLQFTLSAARQAAEHWAVIGPSNGGKSSLLEVLKGQHLCFPPTARSYPFLSSKELLDKHPHLSHPARAIQHVSFSGHERGLSGLGTYLSARYESRRESTDFSLRDFLTGNTQLNALETDKDRYDGELLQKVVKDLKLDSLLDMTLSNLSNGQTRRARIAKALLAQPELLLLDEPFMGLDPPTTVQLSPLLRRLARNCSPRILLSLRPQDAIPDWITHIAYLGKNLQVTHQGPRDETIELLLREAQEQVEKLQGDLGVRDDLVEVPQYLAEFGRILTPDGIQERPVTRPNDHWRLVPAAPPAGEPVIEMEGVQVKYGEKIALGDWPQEEKWRWRKSAGRFIKKSIEPQRSGLWWTVKRGERWAICGPNGSGKTTLLSLLLSDHPQAYSLPMRILGRSRLPQPGVPGISVFDLQRRIGHSSPEVHAFFPKHLTVRRALESAWADTPLSPPRLSAEADDRVTASLLWFQAELNPALGMYEPHKADILRRAPMQRMVDFYGVTQPDLYRNKESEVLYEQQQQRENSVGWADTARFSELTFSGQRILLFLRAILAQPDIIVLDEAFGGLDELVREKCLLFLEHGEMSRLSPFEGHAVQGYTVRADKMGARERNSHERLRNRATVGGLSAEQALVVVSHVKEEIPACVRKWMFLPAAGSGESCRVGEVLYFPLADDTRLWEALWGVQAPLPPKKKPGPKPKVKEGEDVAEQEPGVASPPGRKKPGPKPKPKPEASTSEAS